MARMTSTALDLSALPCGSNCLSGCPIQAKMVGFEKTLVSATADQATTVVAAFLDSYERTPALLAQYPPTIALPALFDLTLSARYAARAVANDGWTYCAGAGFPDGPAQYFAFLKACPRCSVRRPDPPQAKSNKPGSDVIGSIASDLTSLILAEYLARVAPELQVAKSTARQGDVDAVIFGPDLVALAEIKSSPLFVYPLEIRLPAPLTSSEDGAAVPKADHSPAMAELTHDIAFYLAHRNIRIPLGPRSADWPYPALVEYLQKPENVATVIGAWKDLYDVYVAGYRRPKQMRAEADRWRWLICGCSGGIDDSKNAPGLDRSDDMKKGTYQVLKFGSYYKEQCARRVIRAVLLSNAFPLRLYADYVGQMHDVIWTKDKYVLSSATDDAKSTEIMSFRRADMFNLYDALLCLTESRYRDEHLRAIFSRISGA